MNYKQRPQLNIPMSMHGFHALNHCYPESFVSNNSRISERLQVLSNDTLLESVHRFSTGARSGQRTKAGLTKFIMDDFSRQARELVRLSAEELHDLASPPANCPKLQLPLVCQLLHRRYGPAVAPLLLCDSTRWNPPESTEDDMIVSSVNWLQVPIEHLKLRLSKVDSSVIKLCCDLYLSPNQTPKSKAQRYSVLAERFRSRSRFLFRISDIEFFKNYSVLIPYSLPTPETSRHQLVEEILRKEFGHELSDQLLLPPASERKNQRQKEARRAKQKSTIADIRKTRNAYIHSWPQPIPKNIVLDCLGTYFEATQLKFPPICCVCSRRQFEVVMHEISLNTGADLPDYFLILKVTSPSLHNEFQFADLRLSGLMLDSNGIQTNTVSGDTKLCICHPCYAYLPRSSMPRFALANNLYRGILPEEFLDLTWIEERVCARFSNTAVVTRLYQSSDPSQPTVFHGNTCAHEMNVNSTAAVLPRAPSDVNDLLSVVFIGSHKFRPEYLGNMYRIRKSKVWRFLQWLRAHNRLYAEVSLDILTMELYPEDGYLPGIENRVVHDPDLDAGNVFGDETAGMSEHPAELLRSPGTPESEPPSVMIEKMGVSDPECDRMPGRLFTSAALRNLVPSGSDLPDLVLHRGSIAVPEYNNPDLIPGMYPTLFPTGIGGFEVPDRICSISFQQQAKYYLDLADRSFRYHHSFLFVVLNIIQRRTAHLQTHFTVRRSKFETVASKLVAVKTHVLQSVADHLEHEGRYNDLTNEQKDALDLLKHVNTVAARIPGSQAAKIFMRNEIRSYCGFFGLPHLYITLNPNAAHSPIFQVMFGDETVDLSKRFPVLVFARERALRLAKDPVAGADFFNFCIIATFRYLFGWDYDKRESTPSGGILGKLEAFYGSSEFTERGMLHGHFLLWLLGGLNPTDVHQRMCDDDDFQKRFFAYFEEIIHHHLPEIEMQVEKSFEPRVECPPQPPPPDATLQMLNEWDSIFCTQIKMCGEILQRHHCRKVCHKYGNDNRCRFLFPHEIVEASYFDSETNSIFLLVRDSTVNYFNPHLLVFCRHNHDIKCILSGKATKAAMFYITDYITKSDLKTHEMLSLLSRAVANLGISSDDRESALTRSKRLLHKCLSQFTRQQQIHAQQAARYLRGLNDSIPSHETVPMLSALLIAHVSKVSQVVACDTSPAPAHDENFTDDGDTDPSEEHGDKEREDVALSILVDRNGTLRKGNQVVDYLYRGETLHQMSFYDFCRCVRLEKTSTSRTKNTADTRLGVLTRHVLKTGHPSAETHQLVEHTNELRGEGIQLLVPRVVGMSIPRASDKGYRMFALAHFIPFDIDNPLLKPGQSTDNIFDTVQFTDRHLEILNNWEAIHECQDERDAERIRKRAEKSRESRAMTRALHGSIGAEQEIDVDILQGNKRKVRDIQAELVVDLMRQCRWIQSGQLKTQVETPKIPLTDVFDYPVPTASQLKEWVSLIKRQENTMKARRRNASEVSEQAEIYESEIPMLNVPSKFPLGSNKTLIPATEMPNRRTEPASVAETVRSVADKFGLNEKQRMVYNIIAKKFVDQHVVKADDGREPLRMLMTGPGGTGKTHAVRALQDLMKLHKSQHLIRFLGPTGTSAKQIGGMTIHKGLGLSVALKSNGRSNRKAGESNEDFTVSMSVKNRTLVRDEWQHVSFLFIDEVSLIGAQLLCQIDHALRFAKERQDEWFGGINVIFAGDFYQYPPVGNTPLYTPLQCKAPQKAADIEKRLGRLAWKSVDIVVSLSEQQRMKEDPEFAAAVGRLRIRECNLGDVELFNERVIKSAKNPHGLEMSGDRQRATMLVGTNFVRELLNNSKAKSSCTGKLVYCAARDLVDGAEPTIDRRKLLLHLNLADFSAEGALPGLIPLFNGMPVILRNRNISTELGITNGSQGIVRQIFTEPCSNGYSVPLCVIVEFPDSIVEIPGLPPHCFPLTPTTWKFNTSLEDGEFGKQNVRVLRTQLNLQPAFAITGHAAQGKTLPQVLVDLGEGGFPAYVSASRARTRDGLFITGTISLEVLNKPVNSDLRQECHRLERLEHNTKVRYGLKLGKLMPPLDPVGEIDVSPSNFRPQAPEPTTLALASVPPAIGSSPTLPVSIPRRIAGHRISEPTQVSLAGCPWYANSCAYDTFTMLLFSLYRDSSESWRQHFLSAGPWFRSVGESFTYLMIPVNLTDPSCFSKCRDDLRSTLSDYDVTTFPRPGQAYTSIFKVFEAFANNSSHGYTLSQVFRCSSGCSEIRAAIYLPGVCSQSGWTNAARRVEFEYGHNRASIQLFLDLQIAAKVRRGLTARCEQCHGARTSSILLVNPSPWMFIKIPPGIRPRPEPLQILEIEGERGSVVYHLSGIVYYNSSHFVGVWANKDGSCWGYDGLAHGGRPEPLGSVNLSDLQEYSGCEIHIALYSYQPPTPLS